MAKKSKTQFVLLGLLADGPKSGYDIKKIIEVSIGHFWQESYGQIYPVLNKLHQEKLISKKVVQQSGKPDKNIYSIRESGKASLVNWMNSRLEKSPERNELLLRTFFGSNVEPDVMIKMLENVRKESLEMKSFFRNIEKTIKEHVIKEQAMVESNQILDSCYSPSAIQNSTFSILTLQYGINSFDMEAKWAKEAITTLKEKIKESSKKQAVNSSNGKSVIAKKNTIKKTGKKSNRNSTKK